MLDKMSNAGEDIQCGSYRRDASHSIVKMQAVLSSSKKGESHCLSFNLSQGNYRRENRNQGDVMPSEVSVMRSDKREFGPEARQRVASTSALLAAEGCYQITGSECGADADLAEIQEEMRELCTQLTQEQTNHTLEQEAMKRAKAAWMEKITRFRGQQKHLHTTL
jgi:hypothetical protein